MKIIPMGDYYVWYCDWCDSRNLTLWTGVEKNRVNCGACHRQASLTTNSHVPERSAVMAGLI